MKELPNEIRWRRDKKGFVTPEALWLKNELKDLISSTFADSLLEAHGFISTQKFLETYDAFLNNRGAISASDISRTLIAELWLRNFYGLNSQTWSEIVEHAN